MTCPCVTAERPMCGGICWHFVTRPWHLVCALCRNTGVVQQDLPYPFRHLAWYSDDVVVQRSPAPKPGASWRRRLGRHGRNGQSAKHILPRTACVTRSPESTDGDLHLGLSALSAILRVMRGRGGMTTLSGSHLKS